MPDTIASPGTREAMGIPGERGGICLGGAALVLWPSAATSPGTGSTLRGIVKAAVGFVDEAGPVKEMAESRLREKLPIVLLSLPVELIVWSLLMLLFLSSLLLRRAWLLRFDPPPWGGVGGS